MLTGSSPLDRMCQAGGVDDVTWAALTLGAHRCSAGSAPGSPSKPRAGLRAARAPAFTLLPLAAYLTKTLQMFTGSSTRSPTGPTSLVFSPVVWLGIMLAGVSVRAVRACPARSTGGAAAGVGGRQPKQVRRPQARTPVGRRPAIVDDDMADIEAILRKRGIT